MLSRKIPGGRAHSGGLQPQRRREAAARGWPGGCDRAAPDDVVLALPWPCLVRLVTAPLRSRH